MVYILKKDSGTMENFQAMADSSLSMVTTLETLKMAIDMAKEHMSMMAEPMWVPGYKTGDMVQASTPIDKAQSSKETG